MGLVEARPVAAYGLQMGVVFHARFGAGSVNSGCLSFGGAVLVLDIMWCWRLFRVRPVVVVACISDFGLGTLLDRLGSGVGIDRTFGRLGSGGGIDRTLDRFGSGGTDRTLDRLGGPLDRFGSGGTDRTFGLLGHGVGTRNRSGAVCNVGRRPRRVSP
jgi:hypothetical protein